MTGLTSVVWTLDMFQSHAKDVEPITYLQGYATMVKAFKESHAKDVEKLAADRLCEAEKKSR